MRVTLRRLASTDLALAHQMFAMMADVFDEGSSPLSDRYVEALLARPELWVIAALRDGQVIGGLTAHTLPMTRAEVSELFIYDLAVRADHQRQGVGRALVAELRRAGAAAGVTDAFVPADNDDVHALDFYRAIGGEPGAVTIFSFRAP